MLMCVCWSACVMLTVASSLAVHSCSSTDMAAMSVGSGGQARSTWIFSPTALPSERVGSFTYSARSALPASKSKCGQAS